ncbi:MAG: hypothetical protein A2288_00170 [Candidatus Moranbacteria bacterium RIFOXYA12_FULL_44_15]|nr:MAG: hypothetical protein A2288_00170 [Candidatus Moranbacteria bacterium RIFOXYA12_FULL_44_15]
MERLTPIFAERREGEKVKPFDLYWDVNLRKLFTHLLDEMGCPTFYGWDQDEKDSSHWVTGDNQLGYRADVYIRSEDASLSISILDRPRLGAERAHRVFEASEILNRKRFGLTEDEREMLFFRIREAVGKASREEVLKIADILGC